ncbi:MAG TPA: MinD/ParA family protein [Gammaproteobacteria bacterium]|nr:MinD/ParA family protein [Gammaproteobacteria bacterium]
MAEKVVDQALGLRRMANPKPVRVIAVSSGKGGVGKTNVSVNMALAIAATGKNVLLMDADLGLANVDIMLGLRPKYNLSHVLNGERTLEEVIIDGPGGIKVIPASSGVKQMAELSPMENAGVIRAFSELSQDVDVLIVDTAAGISDSVIAFARASQEVVVVVCDEPASLTDAYALIKVLNSEYNVQKFRILSNMTHTAQEARELYNKLVSVADRYLDATLINMGTVPYDDYLRKAIKKQRSVVDAYPRSRSAMAFKNLAQKADKWPRPDAAAGHLEFFLERLIRSQQGQSESRI